MYAVEYTDMAKHARELVDANGFGDVIEVIQGSAESIELPEKVRNRTSAMDDERRSRIYHDPEHAV